MRELVLDTETTGLVASDGHRIVEIGIVELTPSLTRSGRFFHHYLDPERDIDPGAQATHGLNRGWLGGQPRFAEIAAELQAFMAGARVIAHNSAFDQSFIDWEFRRLGITLAIEWVDSLALSRRKHQGGRHDLNSMCDRFKIDRTGRTVHGALLDAELLAEVYRHLVGLQAGFDFAAQNDNVGLEVAPARQRPVALAPLLTDAEIAAHGAFLDEWEPMVAVKGQKMIWRQYR